MGDLPPLVKDTLVRSHVIYEKGWPGISFDGYLGNLENDGILPVILAVYNRCLIYPSIWQNIDTIFGGWTFAGGHGVSQGFNFNCSNPDAFLKLMRNPLAPFCEDLFNVHGERDSFRELVKTGPGLHVCITQPQARIKVGDDAVPYDIHIDKFQVVCSKLPDGRCNYATVSQGAAENMKDHMKEAVPWMLDDYRKKAEKRLKDEADKYKKLLNVL
jgi:hypothetical protein